MENETLESQVERLSDKLIESQGMQINFRRDDEPSPELQSLIIKNLNSRGYRVEFYRFANEPLGVSVSEIKYAEEDEITGENW